MYLYAIKDLNTGLFINYNGIDYKLDPLGSFTTFFKSREMADRILHEKHLGYEFNPVANELAWDELEKLFQKDRWDINIPKEEFNEVVNSYDLKIVKLYLGEIEYEEDD